MHTCTMLEYTGIKVFVEVILRRLGQKPSSLFLSAIDSRVNVCFCLKTCKSSHHMLMGAVEVGVFVLDGVELFLGGLVQMFQVYFQFGVFRGAMPCCAANEHRQVGI